MLFSSNALVLICMWKEKINYEKLEILLAITKTKQMQKRKKEQIKNK